MSILRIQYFYLIDIHWVPNVIQQSDILILLLFENLDLQKTWKNPNEHVSWLNNVRKHLQIKGIKVH